MLSRNKQRKLSSRPKPKHKATLEEKAAFWAAVDMERYYNELEYREKVEKAWDRHRYLYDDEARTYLDGASRKD